MSDRWTGSFRDIPYMGVIYVVAEAMKLGYSNGHPDWCNLGQGQPEVGEMEGAPPRMSRIDIDPRAHAYGPVNGIEPLRERIAAHYNRLYRAGSTLAPYRASNVALAAGGRLMLSRIFSALGAIRLGYQTPDYTAYEDMIQAQERVTPVWFETREQDGFAVPARQLEEHFAARRVQAVVLSNPCNPTGTVIRGAELAAYVEAARRHGVLLILDEFYSHYIYDSEGRPGNGPVSAAAHVLDVDRDPVLIVDGLTKCFRYPGWRVGWALGPPSIIDLLGRAASALDGGPPHPIQHAALEVLEPRRADQETEALRRGFAAKRNVMLRGLTELGVRFARPCEGTFYFWGSIEALPAPLDDGEVFFRAALAEKVLTVPGVFFDVNPGKLRREPSPFRQWVRFSFGPPMADVRRGLERLANMVARARDR